MPIAVNEPCLKCAVSHPGDLRKVSAPLVALRTALVGCDVLRRDRSRTSSSVRPLHSGLDVEPLRCEPLDVGKSKRVSEHGLPLGASTPPVHWSFLGTDHAAIDTAQALPGGDTTGVHVRRDLIGVSNDSKVTLVRPLWPGEDQKL